MRIKFVGIFLLLIINIQACMQEKDQVNAADRGASIEKKIIQLSKDKWGWMSEKKVDSLNLLFHEKAVFVHMGATMSKTDEIEVIRSGGIHYKHVDIQEVSVRLIGSTAILLNKIQLLAIVGGNEVTNTFKVTEVYVQNGEKWVLASLSFTKLLTP